MVLIRRVSANLKTLDDTYDPPVLERVIGRRQNGIDMRPVLDVVRVSASALPVHPAAPIDG